MNYKLFRDAKFWTLTGDALISTVLYFGAKYLAPGAFDDVKFVLAVAQPVVAFVLAQLFVAQTLALRASRALPFFK